MGKSKEFEIAITQSPEMIKRLGEETYTTPEDAIDELVQNGMDAGAKNIYITIKLTQIIFEDDGIGFSKERFDAFCKQGTLYKKKHSKINGKTVAGNKGIGRYAIFKLCNTCELRSKIKAHGAYYWKIDSSTFYAGNNCKFIPTLWRKDNNSGTELLMTNLTNSGKELYDRVEKLKQLIVRNWDVEKINVFVNEEKLKPDSIDYEEEFTVNFNEKVGKDYIQGKAGLTTKEGNINGILIKVNNRGVGKPKLFGIENLGRYGLLISRLRGVLHIDSFSDIINVSRNDFLDTPNYEKTINHIKRKVIEILERKMKQQEKDHISKINHYLTKFLKNFNKILNSIFKKREGLFKSLKGDNEEIDGNKEKYELGEGNTRGGDGKGSGNDPSKDIIGRLDSKKKPRGNLKLGKYNWHINMAPKGIEEKFIVVNINKIEATINTDHPAFKIYTKSSNGLFLMSELIYSLSLNDDDFTKDKIREVFDETIREYLKN